MRLHLHARAYIGAAIFATSTLVAAYGLAAPNDYRFELFQAQPAGPGKTTVTVRLVHLPDGKPVSGAVIFQTRFDMAPERMASMTAPAKVVRASDANLYQLELEPAMGGNWALSLSAKVQGETETVNGTVPITIPK